MCGHSDFVLNIVVINGIPLFRCLHDSGGTHVIVPITINYERVPEQRILVTEVCGSSKKSFCLSDLMLWLKVSTK